MVLDIILACLWFITFVILICFRFCESSVDKELKETRKLLDYVSRLYNSEKSRNEVYSFECKQLNKKIRELERKLKLYE